MKSTISNEVSKATISFGVTGYSFPWDQVGYWASKIVTSVPEALDNLIPAIGKISVRPFRDGFQEIDTIEILMRPYE